MRFLQRPRKKLAGGKAAGMNQIQVLLLFTPTGRGSTAGFPLEQVSGLAPECTAQFAQYVRPIHSAAVVVQPQQRWVADAAFLFQFQERQFLPPQKLFEPANNLGVGHAVRLAQPDQRCKVCFTPPEFRSKLGSVSRRSIHQSCLLWETCGKLEKRASRPLGIPLGAAVRLGRLWAIGACGALCGLWRTSWAVKIGAGRHGGAYCGPGGGLRVG